MLNTIDKEYDHLESEIRNILNECSTRISYINRERAVLKLMQAIGRHDTAMMSIFRDLLIKGGDEADENDI